jgi:hypothetical protein
MLWRYLRREVTRCELFAPRQALLAAAKACFEHSNQCRQKILPVIGSNAVNTV